MIMLIKNMVTSTKLEILVDANTWLVNLYYNIGKNILDNYKYENKFVGNLVMD